MSIFTLFLFLIIFNGACILAGPDIPGIDNDRLQKLNSIAGSLDRSNLSDVGKELKEKGHKYINEFLPEYRERFVNPQLREVALAIGKAWEPVYDAADIIHGGIQDATNSVHFPATPEAIKSAYNKAAANGQALLAQLRSMYVRTFANVMAERAIFWRSLQFMNNNEGELLGGLPFLEPQRTNSYIARQMRGARTFIAKTLMDLEEIVHAFSVVKQQIFDVLAGKETPKKDEDGVKEEEEDGKNEKDAH